MRGNQNFRLYEFFGMVQWFQNRHVFPSMGVNLILFFWIQYEISKTVENDKIHKDSILSEKNYVRDFFFSLKLSYSPQTSASIVA